MMPPPAASASSPAAAPSLTAPALWGSPSSPSEADDLGSAAAPRFEDLGGPAASAAPGRAVPGTEHQLWHLPAAPGRSVPPTRSAPSLALPGTGAAPVPLAQAAARGRWPWPSRCRPWPGEDAEWHRLRRGLGSSISITPPWAGSAPRGTQEPGTAPARGTGGERDPRGTAKPSSCPAAESSRTSQGRSWGAAGPPPSSPAPAAPLG